MPTRMFVIATLLLVATNVSAQLSSVEEARVHFNTGQALFDAGAYDKAAGEFIAAYAVRPFPAFLFNAAVALEKVPDYARAAELFRRYLVAAPQASDRTDVERRAEILEAELASRARPPAPPTGPATSQPTSQPAVPPAPSVEARLGVLKTKGLVVISSKPEGATIYLDDRQRPPLGTTTWNGSLDGEHTVILESPGYKPAQKKILPGADRWVDVYIELSEEERYGFVAVKSNVQEAAVYLDDPERKRPAGITPWSGPVEPGTHRIVVAKDGYTDVEKIVEVKSKKLHNVEVTLEQAPVGFLRVRGVSARNARVVLDGKVACAKAPCRLEVREGDHQLAVAAGGKKTFRSSLTVERMTERTLEVELVDKPSHVGDVATMVFGVAILGGGGALYVKRAECDDKADACRIGSFGVLGLGGLVTLYGLVGLFSDEGPASTGVFSKPKDLAWAPSAGPGYAGVDVAWRW